jgi:hypothetical protein
LANRAMLNDGLEGFDLSQVQASCHRITPRNRTERKTTLTKYNRRP